MKTYNYRPARIAAMVLIAAAFGAAGLRAQDVQKEGFVDPKTLVDENARRTPAKLTQAEQKMTDAKDQSWVNPGILPEESIRKTPLKLTAEDLKITADKASWADPGLMAGSAAISADDAKAYILLMGDRMEYPIVIGTYGAYFSWSNTKNTGSLTNAYTGRPTNDVFYRLTLNCAMEVEITTCGSGLADTYVTLLNSSGGYMETFDDMQTAGTCSSIRHEWVKTNLSAGTYYIVCEGWSQNGSITTQITGRPGNNIATAINAGTYGAFFTWSDIQNTGNFTNTYTGRSTNDVFYRFTLNCPMEVEFKTCGSGLADTYITLLNGSGGYMESFDDVQTAGTCSSIRHENAKKDLGAGTYYIVCEGWSQNGSITTQLTGRPGNSMATAINAGTVTVSSSYTNTQNTGNFTNSYEGRPTNDVFYKFTIAAPTNVIISHCGSEVSDTYVSLLNSNGGYVDLSDDRHSCGCSDGMQGYLIANSLSAGTYYVVTESWSQHGNITTKIEGAALARDGCLTPAGQAVASGGSVTLSHTGYSKGVTSRLWQFSDNNGGVWSNTSATGISYSTGALTNTGPSAITRRYRVKINGQAVYSIEAVITVNVAVTPGSITPATQTVASGSPVTLTHSGGTGITSRLWQQSADGGSTWTDISGATAATYNTGTLNNTGSSAITRRYRVKINGQAVYSAESVITVSVAVTGGSLTPATQTVASGGSVTLTHSGGTGITSRLWQQSADGGSTWTDISGATTATYNTGTLNNTGASNITRRYRVKINGQAVYSVESVITVTGQSDPANNNFTSGRIYINKRVYTREDGSKYLDQVQYYDAFGLPVQNISVGASGNGHDLITLQEHDEFYRPVRTWLPAEKASNRGAYLPESALIPLIKSTYGNDQHPYTKVVYENSALSRALEEYGAGQSWHGSGKAVKTGYLSNTAGGVCSCRQYTCGTGMNLALRNTGTVPAGQLFVTMTTDEDGSVSYDFKDRLGQVVLTRRLENGTQYDTYYIYDNYGMLKAVLPPSASNVLTATGQTWTDATPAVNDFAFLYKYDGRNRCVAKKLPGVEWVYHIYDRGGNLILTQDGTQRSKSPQEWTFTIPDALGRTVLTGLCSNAVPNTGSNPYYMYLWNTSIKASYSGGTNIYKGYALSGLTLTGPAVLAVNYYDGYGFLNTNGITVESGYGSQYANAKGLLTGTLTAQIKSDGTVGADDLYSIMYYDHRGRLVETVGKNSLGRREKAVNEYNFVGQVTASTRTHESTDPAISVLEIRTEQEYDHAGRPTNTFQKIGTAAGVLVTANRYGELGQLAQTTLHEGLETIDYAYNIRGWLTSISSGQFSERLHYHDAVAGLGNTPQWGGNISAAEWQAPGLNAGWHAFKYDYDPLSRLKAGKYSGSNTPGSGYGTNTGYFDESYAYDVMGNMTSLARKHLNTPIDQLSFMHEGNRAVTIADASGNSVGFDGSGTYTYDVAGRMINDSRKGTIAYNHLGLTKSVTKGSDTLKYTYDAMGRRIKRQFNNETPRYYLDGIEYEGGTLKFISTEYGRIRKDASGVWHYDYFLKDHLGNVRVVLEAPSSNAQSNTILYMATMEESKAATEDTYFANLDETRADRPYNYPDKNPLNTKLAKVPGKSKGPSILLPVLAGDTISISAKAFYNMDNALPGQGVDIAPVVGSAIVAMSSPAGTVLGETTRLAVDLGAEASQSVALVNVPQIVDRNGEAKPQSGINFVLYNSRMEVVEENTGVLLVEDRINEIQTLATDNLVMQEAGFLEVYINNEAQTPVYYDNFTVAATTSNVVEINAYYPYGMLIPGLSLMAPPGKWNGYKYSAKELETALNLGVYDFGRRMYDPIAPRFWTPDRFAEKYPWLSPYSYAANNPINNIDVNGDSIWMFLNTHITNPDGTTSIQTNKYYYGNVNDTYGFINASGNLYSGNDNFVNQLTSGLNSLRQHEAGRTLVDNLSGSANSVSILSNRSNGAATDGSYVKWNSTSTSGPPDQSGNNTRDPFIALGHELGHIQDIWNGTYNSNNWRPGIPEGEKYATHIENQIRSEHGIPLRTHYGMYSDGRPVQNTRIIDANGASLFYTRQKTLSITEKMILGSTPNNISIIFSVPFRY